MYITTELVVITEQKMLKILMIIIIKKKEEEHELKLDRLYSCNCTSITEIKNCNILKLVNERKLDKNSIHYNNKTSKNKIKGAKLPSVIKVHR